MDIDEELLRTLRQGKIPFIESGAEEILKNKLGNTFKVTTDIKEVMNTET